MFLECIIRSVLRREINERLYFEYLLIFFNLANAPATFQIFINNILREFLDIFIIIYLNNILIYSKDKEKYVEHI